MTLTNDKNNTVRSESKIAPGWWDYTTLDHAILDDAAKLTIKDMVQLSRPGFKVYLYDSVEDFYLAEALEYIDAWKQATPDSPCGICGPIGPTEQLPLVARLVNAMELDLSHAHFWGMDEWIVDGVAVPPDFPISFAKADMEMCFNLIREDLRMPLANIHFPSERIEEFTATWDGVRCAVMQGGQGEVKHWAFNDPPKREGQYTDVPPPPEVFRALGTRIVDLHPMTLMQNARTSGGGVSHNVPHHAVTVGPVETWKAEKVSIWHGATHDDAFGMRLTALMISKKLADTSVPMSLLADHPNVQFNYLISGFGECRVEMH